MLIGFSIHDLSIAIPALGVGAFCYFLCMPAVNTQIANSVSPEKRAMAFALAVFILHCLGDTAALPAFGAVVCRPARCAVLRSAWESPNTIR
jgi:hypothetical protein